jgi:hypothetical protein
MKLLALSLLVLTAVPAFGQEDRFPNLPPVSEWHGAGWMCEPENYPPEGWLRLGGFCHQICSPASKFVNAACIGKSSLIYTGKDPVFDMK